MPAYALFALALGVLAGAALRRSLAAMSLTLAAFVAVRLAVAKLLRPHYRSPEHETMAGLVPGAARARLGARATRSSTRSAATSLGARGPRDPARAAGPDRPAGVPALARLAARALLPARRPLLDVPGDRGGDLRRARARRSSPRRSGSCGGRRRDATSRSTGAQLLALARRRRRPRSALPAPRGAAAGVGLPAARIRAGASSSSTTRRRTRSSSRRATGSRTRARTSASTLRVDGLEAQRRGRDGARDAAGDHARRGRHRRLGDRPGARSTSRRRRRCSRGIPVVSYNADGGRRQQAARLHRPGSLPVRAEVRRPDRRARPGGRRLPLHRDAGAAEHPAAGRRRARRDQGLRQADPRHRRRDRAPASAEERARIEATYLAHKKPARHVRRRRRLDPGRRRGDAQARACARRGVRAGGYDLLPGTLRAIADGHLDFTIDQQPYLQGFLPILQLFCTATAAGSSRRRTRTRACSSSRGATCGRYLTTTTRYEGSSAASEYPVT